MIGGIYLADRVSTAQHYCGGFAGSRYSAHAGEVRLPQFLSVFPFWIIYFHAECMVLVFCLTFLCKALQILAIVEYIDDPAVHQRHSEGITTVTDSAARNLELLLSLRKAAIRPSTDHKCAWKSCAQAVMLRYLLVYSPRHRHLLT